MGIESIVFVKPKGVGNDTKSGGNRTESLTLDMKELKRPESKNGPMRHVGYKDILESSLNDYDWDKKKDVSAQMKNEQESCREVNGNPKKISTQRMLKVVSDAKKMRKEISARLADSASSKNLHDLLANVSFGMAYAGTGLHYHASACFEVAAEMALKAKDADLSSMLVKKAQGELEKWKASGRGRDNRSVEFYIVSLKDKLIREKR